MPTWLWNHWNHEPQRKIVIDSFRSHTLQEPLKPLNSDSELCYLNHIKPLYKHKSIQSHIQQTLSVISINSWEGKS